MQKDDFATALQESENLLWAAQPEELQAGIRILACQVAYAKRHHEYLPIEEIKQRQDLDDLLHPFDDDFSFRWIFPTRFLTSVGVEPVHKSAI